jgi:CelD/BcsL family acetyltransferase involved in cellulose biosynthesis
VTPASEPSRIGSSAPSTRPGAIPLVVDLEPARGLPWLGEAWRTLEQRAACSFFQSWRWIGTWLAALPGEIEPLCLRARVGDETVGLALLTPRRVRRHGVIGSRQLHLSATGHAELDRLTIEYNGFLLDSRLAGDVQRALLAHLATRRALWDELVLDGMRPSIMAALDGIDGAVVLRQRSVCPYVDLAALEGADGLVGLGPNTRHQIRRMHRLCADSALEIAGTVAEGLAFLAELAELHQAQWQARGQPGAFATDFLRDFHHRLVAEALPAGEAQLLRARAGDGRVIGHLYNFVYRDRVYAYQSGFPQHADNRLKPGLLSHHLAILLNRANGLRFYDFMAGDSRYKRSLSNRQDELIWVVVQRPAARFAVERGLRGLKARLRRRPTG